MLKMRQSHLVRVTCCRAAQWKGGRGRKGKGKGEYRREKTRGSLTLELVRSLFVPLTACQLFRVLTFLKAVGIKFHCEL